MRNVRVSAVRFGKQLAIRCPFCGEGCIFTALSDQRSGLVTVCGRRTVSAGLGHRLGTASRSPKYQPRPMCAGNCSGWGSPTGRSQSYWNVLRGDSGRSLTACTCAAAGYLSFTRLAKMDSSAWRMNGARPGKSERRSSSRYSIHSSKRCIGSGRVDQSRHDKFPRHARLSGLPPCRVQALSVRGRLVGCSARRWG